MTASDGANGFRKPFHVRCKEILDAWTFDKALLPIVQTDRCCSTNFLVGHAEGEIINIEATPDYCAYMYPEDGLITHSNHLVRETRVTSEFERIAPHSLYRAKRLERLLRRKSPISVSTPSTPPYLIISALLHPFAGILTKRCLNRSASYPSPVSRLIYTIASCM